MTSNDLILFLVICFFCVVLVPTLVSSKLKPAPLTSLLTGAAQLVISWVYLTEGLILSSLASLVLGGMWFVALYQAVRIQKDTETD